MEELITYITETGFAVLIAVYLLVRMEKKIENLTDSIKNLNQIIDKLTK
ncbi:MAG TPA: YvrJ family protein [Pseudogracilibacillus sp.]|nr:YvrJ family protein [Pseudogracilibacillus sp.]